MLRRTSFTPSAITIHRCIYMALRSSSLMRRHVHATAAAAKKLKQNDQSISIGGVTIDKPPRGSNRPDLIPPLNHYCWNNINNHNNDANHNNNHSHSNNDNVLSSITSTVPPCQVSHLKWMLQKDLFLRQDFLLLGTPNLAKERRQLLLLYASLIDREVEYVALSRDTSEADLKQRKEVRGGTSGGTGPGTGTGTGDAGSNAGSTTIYVDQAPVRAAREGRLLILDGLEKAERNVLPTLNNLLENRELPLEDGTMLVNTAFDGGGGGDEGAYRMISVHPDFRVAATASISAGERSMLDPPLRSRFQGRLVQPVSVGDMLESVAGGGYYFNGENEDDAMKTLTNLVQLAGQMTDGAPLQSVRNAAWYLSRHQQSVTPRAALNAHGIMSSSTSSEEERVRMIGAQDILAPLNLTSHSQISNSATTRHDFIQTETIHNVKSLIHAALETQRAVALVGPKGCYKSSLAREVALAHVGNRNNTHNHNNRRNEPHENYPYPSPKQQQQPRLPQQPQHHLQLFSLHADLNARDLLMVRTTDDATGNTTWIDTPLTNAARNGGCVILDGLDKLRSDVLSSLALLMEHGWTALPDGTRLVARDSFRVIGIGHPPATDATSSTRTMDGVEGSSWITPEVQGMFHWIRVDPLPAEELRELLVELYPSLDDDIIDKLIGLEKELNDVSVDSMAEQESLRLSLRKLKHICRRVQRNPDELGNILCNTLMMDFLPEWESGIVKRCLEKAGISLRSRDYGTCKYTMDEELLKSCRRVASDPLLVPNVRFHENAGQAEVMGDILEAHSVGEKALLIMGNQGNGKNKVVDKLLSLLNSEREYVQLHRDTTVQSLLMMPAIENGRVVYRDSPLVRAAKYGRVLVLDEADKAPVEVVAVLKGLIEDGLLSLPDGRVLSRLEAVRSDDRDDNIIRIHPDFSVWTLANPAGWPFHGNDLAREMSDVFSCHTVHPMDMNSHKEILTSYGTNVEPRFIDTLVKIWEDLRVAHERGVIAYPFSIRESIAVVKHFNAFPEDGIEGAIDNVIAYDRFEKSLTKHLSEIFHDHGISLEQRAASIVNSTEGGISTPKTRASSPKFGKIDPENTPHVGGNTWAGGTGGSDTAGLGGRGGPYRLDSGHKVMQVTDEMKAQVTKESQRKARAMAKEAFEKKLKELDMGKLDWKRYQSLRNEVDDQITQLKSLLKDLKRRSEERVWLKNQSNGELDENKIVDALSGERDVFKRRGNPTTNDSFLHNKPLTIKLLVDISASMYRFNSYDGRLQRLLEATLMMMEAFRDDKRIRLHIIGHSGSSAKIPLVDPTTSLDEATQLRVLECMVANTQYTYAGDNTVEAISDAISQSAKGDLVIIISDANLKRYHISVEDLSPLQSKDVHSHLIFIGSFGNEANILARKIPNERALVCFQSSDLPLLLKKIVSNSLK